METEPRKSCASGSGSRSDAGGDRDDAECGGAGVWRNQSVIHVLATNQTRSK